MIKKLKKLKAKKFTKKQKIFFEACLCFIAAIFICSGILAINYGLGAGIVQESSSEEISHVVADGSDKTKNMKITLVYGKNKEILEKNKLSALVIQKKDSDGDISVTPNEKALRDYVSRFAKKCNTFVDTMTFTTHSGERMSLLNKSTGWIMDEDYAFQELKRMILAEKTVTLDLTNKSEESNKWWIRIAGNYQLYKDDPADYIEVSIEDQYMWVYVNHKRVLESVVVTGNPNMGNDTPEGAFVVGNKKKNATLYSESYNTVVEYWIGLDHQIGFHDASWQEEFGGDVYLTNGSHGCINMPINAVKKLYDIAYVNMPVFIY